MILRNASENDADQLIALMFQMGYKMNLEQIQSRIASFSIKNHCIIVAELNNMIVGLIAFGCYEQFIAGRCCHIDTLVVHEDFRGRGIGKQLIAFTEKYAIEQDVSVMELITANHRKSSGTHAFYESLGYKDHLAYDYSYFAKEHF